MSATPFPGAHSSDDTSGASATPWSSFSLEAEAPGTGAQTWSTLFGHVPEAEVGLWSIDVGEADDIEVHELAVVLSGRATVCVEGQPNVELVPGSVLTLVAGTPTHWVVHERLTKLFVISATAPE